MALIPAHCRHCGRAFGIPNFIGGGTGGGTVNLSMRGNLTNCPYCGGVAEMLDGDFRLQNDVLRFLSGPEITKGVLEALNAVLADGLAKGIPPEQVLDQVTAVAPSLKPLVKSAGSSIAKWTLLAILGACVADCVKPVTEMISKPVAAYLQQVVAAPVQPKAIEPKADTGSAQEKPLTIKPRKPTQKVKRRQKGRR